jgi:hypothetical protein
MGIINIAKKYARHLLVGEVVEVRSKEEILASLDADGKLDGLPFMPEMLKFCGKQLKVFKRVDKTCDTIGKTGSRRMYNTVHLEGASCDGQSHGGCQAGCLLFWKEAWLKRIKRDVSVAPAAALDVPGSTRQSAGTQDMRCTEDSLMRATKRSGERGTYLFTCQATDLTKATMPMRWWDIRQYVRDLRSGNVDTVEFLWTIAIAAFNAIQRRRRGRTYPFVPLPVLKKTPSAALNLQKGELVRVKSKEEIVATLDTRGKNRGLWFDVEMVGYCGKQYKVARRVEKIIDENTGAMLHLPNDCIVLEGVTCRGMLSTGRLFCPRNISPYWREIWLERVNHRLTAENSK